jgi:tetratricopeptide (TPR) repeat protein
MLKLRANGVRSRWRRTAAVLGGAVLLGVAGYLWAWPHLRAYHYWRQAEAATDQFDLLGAHQHLQACLETWPDGPETNFRMARVCRRVNFYAEAERYLAEAERLGFDADEVALERLLLQAQTGEVRDVLETLVHYLQTGHRDELLIFEALVAGLLDIYHLQETERWCTVWLERYPEDWRPYYSRARAYQLDRRTDRALDDYRQALVRKPDADEVRFAFGDALREHGLLHEALPQLRHCHERHPEDPVVLVSLGSCYRMLGEPERARQLLDGWLEKHPHTEVGVLALRGQVERDLSDPEKALPWLQAAERLAPNNPVALSELVNVLRKLGQMEQAAQYSRKLEDIHQQMDRLRILAHRVSRNPENVELRAEVGTLLLRTGNKRNALRWLLSVLDLDPGHPPTHLALADYYDSVGDPEQARKHRLAAQGKLRVKR